MFRFPTLPICGLCPFWVVIFGSSVLQSLTFLSFGLGNSEFLLSSVKVCFLQGFVLTVKSETIAMVLSCLVTEVWSCQRSLSFSWITWPIRASLVISSRSDSYVPQSQAKWVLEKPWRERKTCLLQKFSRYFIACTLWSLTWTMRQCK